MNSAASVEVKGWCPGALRPMPSGDGLIVRIRPFCGAFASSRRAALADLATTPGQRPYRPHAARQPAAARPRRGATARAACRAAAGSACSTPTPRPRPRAMSWSAPLAGLDPAEPFDVRPIARALERRTCRRRAPARVAGEVRPAGRWRRYRLHRRRTRRYRLAGRRRRRSRSASTRPAGTQWLGATSPDAAPAMALAAAHAFLEARGAATRGRMRNLSPNDHRACEIGPDADAAALRGRAADDGDARSARCGSVVGVAAPFGRLEADQLRRLASLAGEAGATELRLSPWRTVYFGARDAVGRAAGRRRRAPRRPDCRRERSAAADRSLPRRARLQVEQRRYARRRPAAGRAGGGTRLSTAASTSRAAPRAAPGPTPSDSCWSARRVATGWCATPRRAVRSSASSARDDFPALFEGARDG